MTRRDVGIKLGGTDGGAQNNDDETETGNHELARTPTMYSRGQRQDAGMRGREEDFRGRRLLGCRVGAECGSTAGRIPGAVNSGNLLGRRVGDGRDAWGGDEHAAEKSEERRIGRPGGLLESVLCLLSKVTKPTACFCPIGGRRGE